MIKHDNKNSHSSGQVGYKPFSVEISYKNHKYFRPLSHIKKTCDVCKNILLPFSQKALDFSYSTFATKTKK